QTDYTHTKGEISEQSRPTPNRHQTGRIDCRDRTWPAERNELAPLHSITSSARASSVGGTSRPSALAVLRLITSSNLVGARDRPAYLHSQNAWANRGPGLFPTIIL